MVLPALSKPSMTICSVGCVDGNVRFSSREPPFVLPILAPIAYINQFTTLRFFLSGSFLKKATRSRHPFLVSASNTLPLVQTLTDGLIFYFTSRHQQHNSFLLKRFVQNCIPRKVFNSSPSRHLSSTRRRQRRRFDDDT